MTIDERTQAYIKEVYYDEDDVDSVFEDLIKILSGKLTPSTLLRRISLAKEVDEKNYGDGIYKVYEK